LILSSLSLLSLSDVQKVRSAGRDYPNQARTLKILTAAPNLSRIAAVCHARWATICSFAAGQAFPKARRAFAGQTSTAASGHPGARRGIEQISPARPDSTSAGGWVLALVNLFGFSNFFELLAVLRSPARSLSGLGPGWGRLALLQRLLPNAKKGERELWYDFPAISTSYLRYPMQAEEC